MTNKKCPKCGSRSFEVEIKTVAYLFYIVEEGRVIPNGGDRDEHELSHLCACSVCGHKWHPRKLNEDFASDE